MPAVEFVISNPTAEEIEYLEDRLYEYNAAVTGITDGQLVSVFVRDDAGTIVAGIAGWTWGRTCEIRQLWVEESRRKQGLGGRLLAAIEAEARRRQCKQIVLTSYTFQAPSFYVKHGFAVLYVIENHPYGHQQVLLRKVLG